MAHARLDASRAEKWLRALLAHMPGQPPGHTLASLARRYKCSRAMVLLVARGERRPTAAMLPDLRRWCVSPSTMRRALPRIVRWLRGRQVRDDGGPRVYGRGGRRA